MKEQIKQMKENDLKANHVLLNTNFAKEYEPVNVFGKSVYKGSNAEILTVRAAQMSREARKGKDWPMVSSYWGTWSQWRSIGCRPQAGKYARVYFGKVYHAVWNFEDVVVEGDSPELDEILAEYNEIHEYNMSIISTGYGFDDYKGAKHYDKIRAGNVLGRG